MASCPSIDSSGKRSGPLRWATKKGYSMLSIRFTGGAHWSLPDSLSLMMGASPPTVSPVTSRIEAESIWMLPEVSPDPTLSRRKETPYWTV